MNELQAKINELHSDTEYMRDLISDMLDAEGKEDTQINRADALNRALGGYLQDIAKENDC